MFVTKAEHEKALAEIEKLKQELSARESYGELVVKGLNQLNDNTRAFEKLVDVLKELRVDVNYIKNIYSDFKEKSENLPAPELAEPEKELTKKEKIEKRLKEIETEASILFNSGTITRADRERRRTALNKLDREKSELKQDLVNLEKDIVEPETKV